MELLNSDSPDSAKNLRSLVSTHQLWNRAQDAVKNGDPTAQAVVNLCERIHSSAQTEAERLSEIAATEGLEVKIEADPSGQLRLVEASTTTWRAGSLFIEAAIDEGYEPWLTPKDGAAEMFFRARNELKLVNLQSDHTLRVSWPESTLQKRVPSVLMPTEKDWNARWLPGRAWPAYFAVRPLRLIKDKLFGESPALPLGPILGTPVDLLDQLFAFAEVSTDDHVVDLGCGDGRVVAHAAALLGCDATGVELDGRLANLARDRVENENLSDKVTIIEADARSVDLSDATIAFLFIPSESVASVVQDIRNRGFSGTIVSHEQRFVASTPSPVESKLLLGENSLTVAHRWG